MKNKKVTFILIAVFICLISAYLFFNTAFIKRQIISKFIVYVENYLQLQLHYVHINTNYFSWIEISDLKGIKKKPVFEIQKIKIKYNIFSLFQNEIQITDVNIHKLNLLLKKDDLGDWKHIIARQNKTNKDVKPTSSKSKFKLSIFNFNITDSDIHFNHTTIPLNFTFNNLQLHIQKNLKSNIYNGNIYLSTIKYNQYQNIKDVSATLDYLNNQLKFQSFTFFTDQIPLRGTGIVDLTIPPTFEGTISGGCNLNTFESLYNSFKKDFPVSISGTANFEAAIAGQLDSLVIQSHVNLDSIETNFLFIQHMDFDIIYKNRELNFSNIIINCFNGQINGKGYLDIREAIPGYQLDLTVNNVDINSFLNIIYKKENEFKGILNGNVFLKSSDFNIKKIAGVSELRISNASFKGKNIGDIISVVSIENQLFNLHYIEGSDYFFVKGEYNESNHIKANFLIDLNSIETFLNFLNIRDISGALLAQGNINGTINKPIINSTFQFNRGNFRELAIDEAVGGILIKNRQITFQNINIYGKTAQIPSLSRLLRIPINSGILTYNGYLNGKMDNPHIMATINWYPGRIKFLECDSLNLRYEVKDKKIRINNAQYYKDDLNISFLGYANIDNGVSYNLTATIDSIITDSLTGKSKNINHGNLFIKGHDNKKQNIDCYISGTDIDLSFCSKNLFKEQSLRGITEFESHITGTIHNPNVHTKLKTKQFQKYPLNFDQLEIESIYENKIFNILNAKLNQDKNEITVEGSFPIDKSSNHLNLSLNSHNNSLDFITPVKDQYVFENMKLDLTAKITGSLEHPYCNTSAKFNYVELFNEKLNLSSKRGTFQADVRGFLNEPEFNIKWNCDNINVESFFADNFSGEIEYENSILQLKKSNLLIQNRFSYFQGYYPIKISLFPLVTQINNNHPIHVQSFADNLNLTFLTPMLQPVSKINGILNYNLQITGTPSIPRIRGIIKVDQAYVKLNNIDPEITNISAIFNFNEYKASLNNIKASIGNGTFIMHGNIEYAPDGNITNLFLENKFSNINFSRPKTFRAIIDKGQLTLKKENDNYELSGFIDYNEVRYIKNITIKLLVELLKDVSRPKAESNNFTKKIKNNVKIRIEDNLWIYNNLASIKMDADINLLGTLDNLILAGKIENKKGYFYYLDRKFIINKGIINFTDSDKINPLIDVQASTSIKSYENMNETKYLINLSLTGNLEQPELLLTSTPTLSQSDIVAVLTVGRTRNELLTDGTANNKDSFKDILIERARSITNQTIANLAEKQVGTLLDLDNIIIEGNLLSVQDKNGPKVTASKKLTKELDLTYSTVVGYSNDQLIKLGYKISDNISVEGEADQKGRTGIDFKIKYKFK